MMKTRRHHNNKGYKQIKNGTTVKQVKAMAIRLKIPRSTADLDFRDKNGGKL
jgi:hypothetical protein